MKRILGMGYASWTSNDNLELSFEYNQWKEPLVLRFNGLEYKAFILVDDDKIVVDIKKPTRFDAPNFTEELGRKNETFDQIVGKLLKSVNLEQSK